MIVVFFLGCIFLGIVIAIGLKVHYGLINGKKIKEMQGIEVALSLGMANADVMKKRALVLLQEIEATPDAYSKRLARVTYDRIK